ncbi:hypothetical protein ABE438_07500 [Bosea sp. TWI1241]|jgi:hypothetical protein|uniref:hypothetical protein n=1 Tax=Bosea sp. TWI1241 TaxID=3148904 RepID=UPI00320A0E79
MNTDLFLKCCVGLMVNAVLFGVGAVTVLSVPAFAEKAAYLLPAVILASFAATPFIAGWIAPRLRFRNWGREAWLKGDAISG